MNLNVPERDFASISDNQTFEKVSCPFLKSQTVRMGERSNAERLGKLESERSNALGMKRSQGVQFQASKTKDQLYYMVYGDQIRTKSNFYIYFIPLFTAIDFTNILSLSNFDRLNS